MPKVVDHEARRAEIAAAVRRLVLREGTAAATVRRVAHEARWSPGAVRHYFPDQAALLRLVISLTFEEVPARVETHLRRWAEAPLAREPLHDAQLLLEELLPLDDTRSVEMHVWLATMDAARHDADLDEARTVAWAGLRQLSRIAVLWVRDRPVPRELGVLLEGPLEDTGDELAATTLHALLDGLALQRFYYSRLAGTDDVRAVLRGHLEQVARGARAAPGLSTTAARGRSG